MKTILILSDDDLNSNASDHDLENNILNAFKLSMREIHNAAFIMYQGSYGTKVLKNRYSKDFANSIINSLEYSNIRN